jgi:hypothetical protein
MREKRNINIRRIKKVKSNSSSRIESDEFLGFILGYTANGVPYGLTHNQWDEINSDIETREKTNENNDPPF